MIDFWEISVIMKIPVNHWNKYRGAYKMEITAILLPAACLVGVLVIGYIFIKEAFK